MGFMETIAENRIRAAMDAGFFSNLPGQGKPLNLDDESGIPEDLRLTFKILKNAGCLPVEMELSREVYNLRQMLKEAIDENSRKELRRELNYLLLKEAIFSKTVMHPCARRFTVSVESDGYPDSTLTIR
jgi:hypothetical protein